MNFNFGSDFDRKEIKKNNRKFRSIEFYDELVRFFGLEEEERRCVTAADYSAFNLKLFSLVKERF